jgi:S-adenosylmethionine:tRNA ribosyltransferase-isomerase
MRVDEFDYELPAERIAQHPASPRGSSRLMVLDRARGSWQHGEFRRLAEELRPGDLLVRNDARVIRARLRGERPGGGALEVLLLRQEQESAGAEVWSCLARPGRRLRAGGSARLAGGIVATWLGDADEDGVRRVRLQAARPVLDLLEEEGEVPLPPYIERQTTAEDAADYQTVYARVPGAVAAPTAGLHFTASMLDALLARGVELASLTLHVGPGTFLPVRSRQVEEHRMGSERVEIPRETAQAVVAAKRAGRRIVAVGTTTVRALEGLLGDLEPRGRAADVSLFILPGFRFRVVDALITNFHLPRSTLLMLVCALAGRELVLRAYRAAIADSYRFYSYGDAMLIV